MSDETSSGHSATDIITYIGVPLAVLGVLPILYNTAVTLAALSRIKRMLRHSKLTAMTRSDVVNRIIEVELPRYAVRPWDRFVDRSEYWTLSRHRSDIPGGSWTTFNWRTNVIGLQTQRVEYADQLRQPQVDVAFDDLICYLLDLGAVPDPHGWRLLRSTGLWTPVGCSLMHSPDGREKALTIAPLDGSDGHLSLAVTWAGPWTTRNFADLPPYWVRLPPPPPSPQPTAKCEGSGEDAGAEDRKSGERATSESPLAEAEADADATSSAHKGSIDSARRQGSVNARQPITCQISTEGITTALCQGEPLQSTLNLDSLYIDHIRVRPGRSDGVWFASAATAYGTTSQTVLWNYKIPDDVLAFARRETVPCGVLVLLDVVDETATPEWATKYNDNAADLDTFVRRNRERQAAMAAEALMPPAQRQQAAMARQMREGQEQIQQMRDKMRLKTQREDARVMEALQSPKWDTKLVAEHNLTWLKAKELVPRDTDVKGVVGTLLHRMVLDGQFSGLLCRMLDLWKTWAENGGMRRSDLTALQEDQSSFAYATLLAAVIKDTTAALEGTLSMDLQECMKMWRTVRLG